MPHSKDNSSFLQAHISEVSADFSNAAKTYDQNASVQKIMADKLLEQVKKTKLPFCGTTLDLGSGTGYLARIFRDYSREGLIIPSDISLLSLLSQNSNTPILSDFSKLPLKNNTIQNCISNAALQWSPDLTRSFQEINRVLKKDSLICISIMGPDHFKELETATQISGSPFISPIQKHSITAIEELIKRFNWSIISCQENELTSKFESLIQLLRHFRNTGVRANRKEKFPIKAYTKNWPKSDSTSLFPLSWSWHSWIIKVN